MSFTRFLSLLNDHALVRRSIIVWWLIVATVTLLWALTRTVLTPAMVDLVNVVFGSAEVIFGLYAVGQTAITAHRAHLRRKYEEPSDPNDTVG